MELEGLIMTKGMNNKTALQKSLETKKNNLKQAALIEDTETHICIDYEMKKIKIYSNRATVMNRLERLGYNYIEQNTVEGNVYSRSYEFDTKEIGDFLRTGIFKFN